MIVEWLESLELTLACVCALQEDLEGYDRGRDERGYPPSRASGRREAHFEQYLCRGEDAVEEAS